MTDETVSSETNQPPSAEDGINIGGNVTGGNVGGTIQGDLNNIQGNQNTGSGDQYNFSDASGSTFNFGNTYQNDILRQYTLDWYTQESKQEVVSPSGLDDLLSKLKQHHILLLEGTRQWGHIYLAETIIDAVAADGRDVFKVIEQVNGDRVLDALKTQKENDQPIKKAVILIEDATAADFDSTTLEQLQSYAKNQDLYIILTSTERSEKWQFMRGDGLVELTRDSPYTVADIAQWISNIVNKNDNLLHQLVDKGFLPTSPEPITPNTPFQNSDICLIDVVEASQYSPGPYLATRFRNYLGQAETPKELLDVITDQSDQMDERLQQWFNQLNEEERYVVLTVGLLSGIPQHTFWAIYERLIQEHWRYRDTSLRMADYLQIQVRLNDYIEVSEDQIRFIDRDTRKVIIQYALSNYRRSLVNALPFIANLLGETERPATTSQASLNDNMALLEIWGSDLTRNEELLNRRQRLRDSLITSIVEIYQQEPETTRHILQAWAEQPFYAEMTRLDRRSLIIKQAFSDVVYRIYLIEDEPTVQGFVLTDWYATIQREDLQVQGRDQKSILAQLQSQVNRNARRTNIRMSIAFALCEFADNLSAGGENDLFGAFSSAESLLTTLPAQSIGMESFTNFWQMLVAMAWEPDDFVRLTVAERCARLLTQDRSRYFLALLRLFSGDWKEEIRYQVAIWYALIYRVGDEDVLQIIYNLLMTPEDDMPQRRIQDSKHYLVRQARTIEDLAYPPHVWTATMAIFLIGMEDPNVFYTYLKTVVNNEELASAGVQSAIRAAFSDILVRLSQVATLDDSDNPSQLLYYYYRHYESYNLPRQIQQLFEMIKRDINLDGTPSSIARMIEVNSVS